MQLELDITRNKTIKSPKGEETKADGKEKLMTFGRSDIYFNDRKSVMLNVRDITKMNHLHETIKTNKMLKRIYSSIAADFMGPF